MTARDDIPPEQQPACPACGRPAADRLRGVWPFCSDRCKLLDLGRWAREEYRIPTAEQTAAGLEGETEEETIADRRAPQEDDGE